MVSADFDQDGYEDLAASSYGSPALISIIFGSPDGLDGQRVQFWTAELLGTDCGQANLSARSLSAGDWNDDGRPDLAVGTLAGLHVVYSGDGVFSDRFQPSTDGSPCG